VSRAEDYLSGMDVFVKADITERFTNVNEAARAGVNRHAISGLPVRLRFSRSDAEELLKELSKRVARKAWGNATLKAGR
jgi:hypothetical protein